MYVVVEGPIGVGKTSLSRRLAARYGAELSLEVVEENPFLARFYEHPDAYAFQVQVFFLLSRFKQLSALAQGGLFAPAGNVVGDYLFAKDFIFAAMNLHDHEFELYRDLYAHLSPRLPTPDLVIYLRAETDVLLRRIEQRGRSYEQDMQAAYLSELTTRYDEFFRTYPGRLLTIAADEIDFVGDAQHEAELMARIHEALSANSAAD
ncbi:deoxynucleoside kinase [Deinococcus sp. KNUC1210]|uniref:deoxynucleoside kinase n=1 Tax=Deinococcus sp. KNUC1210 TaxID=2917691 RepID=UPI001EF1366F|nr:deoxynucleoside kinase [Deinococcus sp. KNUC1210]ULH14409.1 deoxynucleoside kinase [Deinococcus sp. KNUC1210]